MYMENQQIKNSYMSHMIGSPILIHYFNCYRELESTFCDLVKHDLKNNHSSVLIALDLYKLKRDDKYLEMAVESAHKCLAYIDHLRELEPFFFDGGNIGFYSCREAIQMATRNHLNTTISGNDCFVFADTSLNFIFKLLFSYVFEIECSDPLIFNISSFSEDGIPKCRIDLIIPAPAPQEFIDICTNPEQNIIGDLVSVSSYGAVQITNRYSGVFSLIDHNDKKTTISLILHQENELFCDMNHLSLL